MNQKKAVILLSGGLDSATVVAMAKADGYACYTMSFDYGQRHRAELQAAERVARQLGVIEHKVIGLDLNGMGGSALTDESIAVPESPSEGNTGDLRAGAQYGVPLARPGLGRGPGCP
ncbi:7-cyano-7-deazaguanine synthase [Pseudomonas aeruginosa]|nr:7-cyano-7-deazaguanine synthase [Pseudomonas aeruginosa]